MPTLNTASLPDLIFTLLFFFMITTTMRQTPVRIDYTPPKASEIEKLEKKSLVTYIYVGKPARQYQKQFGSESVIQLNDKFAELSSIQDYIAQERAGMREDEKSRMQVSLNIDRRTKMGIVSDLKEALREAQALKISYNAVKGNDAP